MPNTSVGIKWINSILSISAGVSVITEKRKPNPKEADFR